MNIKTEKQGNKMTVNINGRLDTMTAPEMESKVLGNLDGIEELILDLSELSYMSSAGLRVILACQKKINAAQGSMVVKNVNELIMDIFDATGFIDILTIENEES